MTDSPPLRHALVVAQRPSDYAEMRRCAKALNAIGWRITMLYVHGGPQPTEVSALMQEMEGLRSSGVFSKVILYGRGGEFQNDQIGGVGENEFQSSQNDDVEKLETMVGSLVGFLRRFFFGARNEKQQLNASLIFLRKMVISAVGAVATVMLYYRNSKNFSAIVARVDPDVIILPEDIVGPITPLFIKAGHRHNIPSVIIPYTISNQQEAFRSLLSNPSYVLSNPANRLVAWFFPRWRMQENGVSLVRLPAPYIVCNELTRTAPPDPWMMNSGYANRILVENEAMLDYYCSSGLPVSKMAVVGAIYDDQLAAYAADKPNKRCKLDAELGFDSAKPFLLIGGTADQTSNCPPGFEFADMSEFCRQFALAFVPLKEHYNIAIRPHPNNLAMGEVFARNGIVATLRDTAELVPICDFYVAISSATIRWAIACAIPTINYDVFHYAYDDYKKVDGVLNLDRFEDVRAALADLSPDGANIARLRTEIRRSAARWGMLDGKSTARIAAEIDALCRSGKAVRTTN